jgi:succinoglycan biosynthesis protein ExoA
LVDNPRLITPCAMNAGISAARGKYIAIMGGHTEYARDYIAQCVQILETHPEICCSGGTIISEGKSTFGRAVAFAMSHPVGIGNAKHRYPEYEGYAEGACFPVFRREILDQVGLYDENLVRNQDDDLNYRIAKIGGKIFISRRARARYFVRESPRRLFNQYLQYGFWRVAVLRKHRLPASFRQLVPVTFFLTMFLMLVLGMLMPGKGRVLGAILPVAYTGGLLLTAINVAFKKGWRVGMAFPIAVFILHFAYAAGFVWGIAANNSTNRRKLQIRRASGTSRNDDIGNTV